MPFWTRKKIVLQVPCWIRFGMFWDLQGSILGCVASMLDLFCVLVFNLGPILGFRGTIGAPSTPFYLLEKGCLFLDGTFSISRPCTLVSTLIAATARHWTTIDDLTCAIHVEKMYSGHHHTCFLDVPT